RLHPAQEPAEHAVGAPERKLHLEGVAGSQAVGPTLEDAGEDLGIVHRLPAPALHRLRGAAGVLRPPAVEVVEVAARERAPGEPRQVLHDRTELPLALAQRLLGAPAVLDVDDASDVPHELAGAV